jgi:hypothetical protein
MCLEIYICFRCNHTTYHRTKRCKYNRHARDLLDSREAAAEADIRVIDLRVQCDEKSAMRHEYRSSDCPSCEAATARAREIERWMEGHGRRARRG